MWRSQASELALASRTLTWRVKNDRRARKHYPALYEQVENLDRQSSAMKQHTELQRPNQLCPVLWEKATPPDTALLTLIALLTALECQL